MRNFPLIIFRALVGLLTVCAVNAHTVDWMENPTSYTPANPMVFYYPRELSGKFFVDPSYGEPCTVVVNITSVSTLVNAQPLPPTAANSVEVLVQILRAPSNHTETATITGEWHATGLPTGFGCDAVNPNPFSVPVTVTDQSPLFRISSINNSWVMLSGPMRPLLSSSCLTGPWSTIGFGQTFSVRRMPDAGFFTQTREVGKFIGGIVLDNGGSPQPNLTIGLQYGGLTGFTDSSGYYSIPRVPIGLNWLSITNPIGANLNIAVTNKDTTSSNSYTVAMIKAAMVAAPLISPTNLCNCTPWCAIGFGTVDGGNTAVYYSGGANNPNGGTPDCGVPTVTVTPPVGAAITISAGTGHHHNSGPNPASGTWTVTAVVCGQTKTASVTVP